MLLGYARVSKVDGSQNLDLQMDALIEMGVDPNNIYYEEASGKNTKRTALESCLKALRKDDTLVVWKLDRLGRSLHDLVNLVQNFAEWNIGLKVITGKGANIDTTTASGKLAFGIFAALAEFERELIRERTLAGLQSARARGNKGGRKFNLTKGQVRLAEASMKDKDTNVSELCRELKISRQTLYRYVSPKGELRQYGKQVLGIQSADSHKNVLLAVKT